MTKIFNILPRTSGKTEKAVAEFLLEPYSSILIVKGNREKKYIIEKYHLTKFTKYIHTIESITLPIFNATVKNLIIDEYLSFSYSNIDTVNYLIGASNLDSVSIYTSIVKQFDSDIFYLVQRLKNRDYGASVSYSSSRKEKLFNNELSEIMCETSYQEYLELFDNILTDDDVTVLTSDYETFGTEFLYKSLNHKPNLSKIEFEMAFESKYLHKFKWIKEITYKKFQQDLDIKQAKLYHKPSQQF